MHFHILFRRSSLFTIAGRVARYDKLYTCVHFCCGCTLKTPCVSDGRCHHVLLGGKCGFTRSVSAASVFSRLVLSIEKGGQEGKRDGLEDLDFYMGKDALEHSTTHQISYPIRHGLIEVCLLPWYIRYSTGTVHTVGTIHTVGTVHTVHTVGTVQ